MKQTRERIIQTSRRRSRRVPREGARVRFADSVTMKPNRTSHIMDQRRTRFRNGGRMLGEGYRAPTGKAISGVSGEMIMEARRNRMMTIHLRMTRYDEISSG